VFKNRASQYLEIIYNKLHETKRKYLDDLVHSKRIVFGKNGKTEARKIVKAKQKKTFDQLKMNQQE